MTKIEQAKMIELTKQIRELSFKNSDAFLKVRAVQAGQKVPKQDIPTIEDVKKAVQEIQSLATSLNNRMSNETTMEAR